MAENIQISIAKIEDVEDIARISYQVAKLHDENAPEYFKPIPKEEEMENIREMFDDERIIVFKAVYEGKICGFLFLEMIHRQSKGLQFSKLGNILNLGVDEKYRTKGIGTALINFTEQYVRDNGGETLDLCVFAFNTRAIKLYERLGYKTIDVSMRKVLK
jgi:ribosomal protein S18 acetylase RimI-like enzyme